MWWDQYCGSGAHVTREIVMGTSGIASDFLDKTLYSEFKTMSRNTKSVSMEQI